MASASGDQLVAERPHARVYPLEASPEARDEDIEADAHRPPAELLQDVADSNEQIRAALAARW